MSRKLQLLRRQIVVLMAAPQVCTQHIRHAPKILAEKRPKTIADTTASPEHLVSAVLFQR